MELLESKASEVAHEIAEKKGEYIRAVLGANDWDETPIVDIVWVRRDLYPQTSDGGHDRYTVRGPKVTFEYHQSPAPSMAESATEGEKCEVQRVTRPLYEKALREYPELAEGVNG